MTALLSVSLGGALFASARTEPSRAPTARTARAARPQFSSLPLGLQNAVSTTAGASSPQYHVSASGASFRASNDRQNLQVGFDSRGVEIHSSYAEVRLHLDGWGYGSRLGALDPVRPVARANSVSYRHPDVTEWYRNEPLGLEQGFTIRHAPTNHAQAPLTLSIAMSTNTGVSLGADRRALRFGEAGHPAIKYGALTATDSRGRILHSWLALDRARLLIHVDTRGARLPLTIDPLLQQGAKLTAADETGGSEFGYSVALSADGNTALIGGDGDNGSIGAAWVFTRSGATWTQEGTKLTGSGESGKGLFGFAVALSADGNTALIGAPGDRPNPGFGEGAAWVFTRSGSTWTQQGTKLTGAGASGEAFFGNSVSLSAEGNIALIGGEEDNAALGAAWVFTRSGSTWTQQGEKLTGSGETGNPVNFGVAVALSAEGNTALIGGNNDNSGIGAAWVFTRSGSTWTQQGEKLTGSGESGEGLFAGSVALSADGNTAVMGANNDEGGVGAAWVFTRSGSTWTQQGAKLTGAGESGHAIFGVQVALSPDGNTSLIGGDEDNSGVGAAWVFTRSGSTWTQQGAKLTGTGESGQGYFGGAVAISSAGETALIGGLGDSTSTGGAWAFALGAASEEEHKEEPKGGSAGGGSSTTATTATVVTPPAGPPAPVAGQRQTVSPAGGTVTVRLAGTSRFVALSAVSSIPNGSEVDATNGRVIVTVATPTGTVSAEVYGGRFVLHQDHTGGDQTHFVLSLPLTGCPRVTLPHGSAAAVASHAKHGPKSRHLWVSEHGGSWGTNGRYVSTTVEGTRWLTLDECSRSEVQVAAGKVKVRDLVRKKTKPVGAGKSYVASRLSTRRGGGAR